jgi:hypothetical protein
LFGGTHPFDAATLAKLYSSKDQYVAAYRRAADSAIAAGFVLEADRAALLAEADKVAL